MKKSLIVICMLLCSIAAFAGNPIKAIDGKENLKDIMGTKADALVELDWSNAKYDKSKDLKTEFAEDYDYILNDCEKNFIEGFNKKSKGLQLAKESTDAKYKVVLKVTNVDHYFQPMSFVPKNEAKMWGNLEIIDLSNNQTVVTVVIDEAEDGLDFTVKDCYGKTFNKLGERIAKLK